MLFYFKYKMNAHLKIAMMWLNQGGILVFCY